MRPFTSTHFRTYQQTTEYTCGAACSLMVLSWFGKTKYHEMLIGQLIESIPEKGLSAENIADFFDLIGWEVDYHADTSLRFQEPEEFERYVVDCIDTVKGKLALIEQAQESGTPVMLCRIR